VHEEGYGITSGPGGKTGFTTPDGKRIPNGPDRRFRGNVVALKVRNRQNYLGITPNTPVPKWRGEIMDNQLAVLGLIQRE
jgi:hypothetical protein